MRAKSRQPSSIRRLVGTGTTAVLILSASIIPAAAATGWPTSAGLVASWRDAGQTSAAFEVRSARLHSAGSGWFKLKSDGNYTIDCDSVTGREYGRVSAGKLVLTDTLPVSSLYCDGSIVTGKLSGMNAGSVYALRAGTDPIWQQGAKTFSGTVQVDGRSGAPTAGLRKTTAGNTLVRASLVRRTMPSDLAWSAEFNRTTAKDLADWNVSDDTTYGTGGHSTNVMRADEANVRVESYRLRIQSHPVRSTAASLHQPFSSGYLTSDYVLDLSKPGRLDAWIKPNLVPGESKGKWPGLWLRNRDNQEFDVTEMIGTSAASRGRASQYRVTAHLDTMHVDKRNRTYLRTYAGSPTQFHLWQTSWDGRGNITVSCDGKVAARFTTKESPWMSKFTGKFQIRLDQFMQGDMPGSVDAETTFNQAFEVGYLRYYTD